MKEVLLLVLVLAVTRPGYSQANDTAISIQVADETSMIDVVPKDHFEGFVIKTENEAVYRRILHDIPSQDIARVQAYPKYGVWYFYFTKSHRKQITDFFSRLAAEPRRKRN